MKIGRTVVTTSVQASRPGYPHGLAPAAIPAETDPPPGPEPTRERRRHGQELEFGDVISDDGAKGRAFRVASSLYLLHRSRKIGGAEVAAAERWYRDWITGIEGARDPDQARSSGADQHSAMLARVAAATRCRAIRAALGLCGEIRLRLLMVEQLSFTAMARQLAARGEEPIDRNAMSAQTQFLLRQLAERYAAMDADRRRDG